MFGELDSNPVLGLTKRQTLDAATAKLLEFAEFPKMHRWIQFPSAVIVLLAHPDALDCGAIYVYDRKRCVWLWVDFNDRNYGGYSPEEFDILVNQCHFLRLVESPHLLSPATNGLSPPASGHKARQASPSEGTSLDPLQWLAVARSNQVDSRKVGGCLRSTGVVPWGETNS